MSDAHLGERIAKVIARAGLASRREAEAWIAAGRVAVNGSVISSPALNVTERDRIAIDGNPLPQRERTRLFLYHKPRGLVTTHSDPQGRPTIFASLPRHLPRLISIGRLDLNTEGLLLLSNDGELARMLELPQTAWLRRYRVRALGRVTQEALDALSGGITIKGMHYGAIEAMLDREQRANVWLTVGIREGKNREVRNVLEHLGLKVSRLIRVAFGPFELGEIERGGVVEVSIERMREALGDLVNRFDLEGPVFERENATRRHSGARAKARESEIQRKGQRSHLDPGPALRAARSDRKQTRRDRSGGPRPARPRPKGAR